MTFFARQEAARRKTRVLLLYYGAAVVLIVCAFYLASRAIASLAISATRDSDKVAGEVNRQHARIQVFAWDPFWMLITAGVSFAVIGGGTLFRRASLAGGGAAVAVSAGGREIVPDKVDSFLERRLLNIVEEAALASSVPVPRVFVLQDESGINAFAAGFSLRDAAVAVTRGALERLSREELHGVIAHEFSHIKNGDMRLNSWLLGILFGILVTSIVGRQLIMSMRFMRFSRNRKGGGGAGIVLIVVLAGLALWVIGSVGIFFARLIQASVSRQREFLADASAVQFTRNPAGLAGALKRIGASGYGSTLRCANRSELAHLLFSSGTKLSSLFASHPPILTRIRQLEPDFTGDFSPWMRQPPETDTKGVENAGGMAGQAVAGLAALARYGVADEPRSSLPGVEPGLREALARPMDAAAAIYGLLLSEEDTVCQRQRSHIFTAEGAKLAEGAERWREAVSGMDRSVRRQVVDLAVAGVRQRDPAGRDACLTLVRELADADRSISLFEAMLMGRVQRALHPPGVVRGFYSKPLPPVQMRDEAATVLGVMAYLGQPQDDAAAETAWREGATRAASFGVGSLPVPARRACTLTAFDAAVKRMDGLSPLFKGEILMACSFVMRTDGDLTEDETELLNALADLLDMPLGHLSES